MAWSPQARTAALAARKRKHHGSATKHIGAKYTPTRTKKSVKYKLTAKHPTSQKPSFKSKAKKVAKYTATAGAVGGYVGYYAYRANNHPGANLKLQTKADKHNQQATYARRMSRKLPANHTISKRLSKTAMYHTKQGAKLQRRVNKKKARR